MARKKRQLVDLSYEQMGKIRRIFEGAVEDAFILSPIDKEGADALIKQGEIIRDMVQEKFREFSNFE